MFDFLFKRSAKRPVAQPVRPAPQEAKPVEASARHAAMTEAAGLDDETAAAAFILKCDFAEARLKAAELVQSEALLESVIQAMRNTDRRVAKLMQGRLDIVQKQKLARQQAERCVADARRLEQEAQLMANQVADLDRAWSAITAPPADLQEAFTGARDSLRQRLEAQAGLQRAVIDVLARLRTLREVADQTDPAELAQSLQAFDEEIARHCAAPEAASLPKHLLPEFATQHQALTDSLAALTARHAALAAREEALAGWEAAEPETLKEHALKQGWDALPAVPADETQAALQARFEVLLQRTQALRKPKVVVAPVQEDTGDLRQRAADALDGLEKALEDGALQAAADHDKVLRALDLKSARLSEARQAQLARARAELGRLQGWARWGGNVSREELLKAADGMPAQNLAPLEVAKKVGSLRERWKSLDISAGPSSRELWERFDTACTTAYAPAAAHFKKLAEERQNNMAKAEAMIAEIAQFAQASGCAEPGTGTDWKEVAAYCQRTSQAWQRLGTIDRKDKKRLDAEFELALQAVSAPLDRQRQVEVRQREKLIAEVAALNPADRFAPESLRGLQERWQEHAKALPLARKEEQELWQRFRSACDELFARRKEGAVAADAERGQHLQEKEALCAALEAAEPESEAAIGKLLRESRDAWGKIGPAPRAAEATIEARFQAATAALQNRLDTIRRAVLATQMQALSAKLILCRELETSIVAGNLVDNRDARLAQWQALPALSSQLERALLQRFNAALDVPSSGMQQYVATLERNGVVLAQELLRLEIMTGIESPAELSRERLKLQVEVLQSSLKAGQKPLTPEAQLLQVVGLAAVVDARTAARLERVVTGFAAAAA